MERIYNTELRGGILSFYGKSSFNFDNMDNNIILCDDTLRLICLYLGKISISLSKDLRKHYIKNTGLVLTNNFLMVYGVLPKKDTKYLISKYTKGIEINLDTYRKGTEIPLLPELEIIRFKFEINRALYIPNLVLLNIAELCNSVDISKIKHIIIETNNTLHSNYNDWLATGKLFYLCLNKRYRDRVILYNSNNGISMYLSEIAQYCDLINRHYNFSNPTVLYKHLYDYYIGLDKIKEYPGKIKVIVHYNFNDLLFLHTIFVPVFKKIGVEIEVIIFGKSEKSVTRQIFI